MRIGRVLLKSGDVLRITLLPNRSRVGGYLSRALLSELATITKCIWGPQLLSQKVNINMKLFKYLCNVNYSR